MRSLIIAPPDEKRLAEALASGAGAVIADLALAPSGERIAARDAAARFLKGARGVGPELVVAVNALELGRSGRRS